MMDTRTSFFTVLLVASALSSTAFAQSDCGDGQQLDSAHGFMADPFLADPEWVAEEPEPPSCVGDECVLDEPIEAPEFSRGVEIDDESGEVNLETLARSGLSFVLIRAADGMRGDERFDRSWEDAASTDLFRGGFQIFDAGADPVAQAELLLYRLGDLGAGDLPPSLIVPESASPHAISTWAEVIVAQTGREPLIHASATMRSALESAGVSALFWGTRSSGGSLCSNDAVELDLIRYSEDGRVPGIARTGLDVDVFRGGFESLADLAGGAPWMDAPYATEALPEGAGGGGGPMRLAWPVPYMGVPRGASGWKNNGHHVCGREVNYACEGNRYRGGRAGHWHHYGNDLLAPVGTPVRAPAGGIVVGASYPCPTRGRCSGDAGNVVQLQHADGSRTRYLHLSNPSEGRARRLSASRTNPQRVDCGENIGLTGLSGNASSSNAVAPHLHFEYNRGGGQTDPFGTPTASGGGSCRCVPAPTSARLWIDSCSGGTTPTNRDDSRLTRAEGGEWAPGETVTARGTFENTGGTTWTTAYSLVRTVGTFGPARVAIPSPVTPTQSRTFELSIVAPEVAPGTTVVARYRLVNAAGAQFGADWAIRFSRPRETATSCRSFTLGRDVPANTCVQRGSSVSDACQWFRCVGGRWAGSSAGDSACTATHPNAMCGTSAPTCPDPNNPSQPRLPEGTCWQNPVGDDAEGPACGWRRCEMGNWVATTSAMCDPSSESTIANLACEYDAACQMHTTCGECTADRGCGFCNSDGRCHATNYESYCTDWRGSDFECLDCTAITDCLECAVNGCGWCASSGTCMNARSGGAPVGFCGDWHYTDTLQWCLDNP